jgi:hypothetical protein
MWAGRTESGRRRRRHFLSDRCHCHRFPTLPTEVCSLQRTPPRQSPVCSGGSLETDGRPCWARGEPHSSRVDTSADDSGRIAIIAVFLCCRRYFFLRGEWQTHDSGFAVTRTSDIPLRLRHQNRELAPAMGQ